MGDKGDCSGRASDIGINNEKDGPVTLAAVDTEGLLSPMKVESRHVSVTALMF